MRFVKIYFIFEAENEIKDTYMKSLIVYTSETGNTKKLAETIYEMIDSNKELKKITDVKDTNSFDLIFIGFPIHNFEPAQLAQDFIKTLKVGKKAVLFATHAMQTGSPMNAKQIENCRKIASELEIWGFFSCRGELSKSVTNKMINSTGQQMRYFGQMRQQTIGHPDTEELEKLKVFTKEILKKAKKGILK